MTTGEASWVPCPACFRPSGLEARFCASCGASLSGSASIDLPGGTPTRVAPTVAFDPAATVPGPATLPGTAAVVLVSGRYRIRRELGRGSFGAVFEAVDEQTGRAVAVKMLTALGQAIPEERDRALRWFRREAKVLGWLDHPGIVALVDMGDDQGIPWLAMELVQGETLAHRMAREGRLQAREGVRILRELLAALGHAHRSGVIHRDLKPANVLLDARGTVKVSDFGLAKLEHSLASIASRDGILGTPHYMSPEQAAGREIDARSDLFSVGSLAYELLTGIRPFDGPVTSAIYKIIYEAPPPPSSVDASLPAEVDAFVRRALEKSPDVRFATAEEMADALEGATLFLSRATTQEIDVPSALAGASAPLPPTLDLPAPGRGRRSPETPRSPPRDLEQRLVLPGVVAVLAMGVAVLVMLWRQPSGALPGAPPGGVLPDASSSKARVFVDGAPAQGGRAPSGAETSPAVVTLLLPGGMVWRDRAAPPESASDLASRVATKARRVEGSVAEEAQVLGTVIEGARPLALVEVPEGRRWLEVGDTLGDGAVAAISPGDVAFRVPLASGGTAEVRRALRDVAGRGRSQIEVRTDPSGALVMLGDERHAVGYTPCAVAMPPAERVTIRLKGRNGREVVLPGLAVDRLAAMGEVRVAMP